MPPGAAPDPTPTAFMGGEKLPDVSRPKPARWIHDPLGPWWRSQQGGVPLAVRPTGINWAPTTRYGPELTLKLNT